MPCFQTVVHLWESSRESCGCFMLLDSQINHQDAFSEGLSNGFEMPSQKGWDLTKSILRQLTEVEGSSCTHARHSMIQPTSGSMLYKVEHVSLIQSKMTKLPLSVHISSLGLDGKAVHTVGLIVCYIYWSVAISSNYARSLKSYSDWSFAQLCSASHMLETFSWLHNYTPSKQMPWLRRKVSYRNQLHQVL